MMMKNTSLLLKSWYTVFTTDEIALFLNIKNKHTLRNSIVRLKEQWILISLYRGIFGLPQYSLMEFINKLKVPSYISLETVLQQSGIVFQNYEKSFHLISSNSKYYKIDLPNIPHRITVSFHKMKTSLLFSSLGIIQKKNYRIATPERALCDRLYLSPNYYFDNTENLNIQLLKDLKSIYPQTTALAIQKIIDANN